MTYNEWRDELKSNLLSVSEAERKRVLDYYAEAYADRREAGFSEREIIEGFGAPYDAAQRILNENIDDGQNTSAPSSGGVKFTGEYVPPSEGVPFTGTSAPNSGGVKFTGSYDPNSSGTSSTGTPPPPPSGEKYGWLFIVLCVVFCVPLFGFIMTIAGIILGLCIAPFALIVSGVISICGSIAFMVGGDIAYGFYILGSGLIASGIGIILLPLFIKIVKFIWMIFKKLLTEIKNLFKGEQTV